jgi:hypothetical protein
LKLWAITCYWNAARFARRLHNYRVFREHLQVPLLTVELSFADGFDLAPPDADRLVQLKGGSVLWQKERLLNVAARALPDSCENVAWLDADILFEDEDWSSRANEALEHSRLLQLFDRAIALGREEPRAPVGGGGPRKPVESVLAASMGGREVQDDLRSPMAWSLGQPANGLAWAARREFFDRVALYDACILGSGDRALVCAALGVPELLQPALRLSPAHMTHYLCWASRFRDWLDCGYAFLRGTVFHLWHGQPEHRRIEDRYDGLERFRFDPNRDVEPEPNGAWRWATDKRAMHEYVSGYFFSRMENG